MHIVGFRDQKMFLDVSVRERSLMTSHIRVGGSKIAPKKGRHRVGQGREVGKKWPKKRGTSLVNVP